MRIEREGKIIHVKNAPNLENESEVLAFCQEIADAVSEDGEGDVTIDFTEIYTPASLIPSLCALAQGELHGQKLHALVRPEMKNAMNALQVFILAEVKYTPADHSRRS